MRKIYIKIFALSLALICGCRKSVNNQYVAEKKPEKKLSSDLVKDGDQLINGSALVTSNLFLTNEKVGTHYLLKIEADRDPSADYMQFVICSMENPAICKPSQDNPGEFAIGYKLVPNVPAGVVQVKVRSCIRPLLAQDPHNLCGTWAIKEHEQPESDDEKLAELLEGYDLAGDKIKDECQKAHESLAKYKTSPSDEEDPAKALQNPSNLAETAKNMGEDLCAEMMTNGNLDGADISAEEEGWGREPSAGGIILLIMGGAAILGGGIAVGLGIAELQKLKNAAQKNMTTEIETKVEKVGTQLPPQKVEQRIKNPKNLERQLINLERRVNLQEDLKVLDEQSKALEKTYNEKFKAFDSQNPTFAANKRAVLEKVEFLRGSMPTKELVDGKTVYIVGGINRDDGFVRSIESIGPEEWTRKEFVVKEESPSLDSEIRNRTITHEVDEKFETVKGYYELEESKQREFKNIEDSRQKLLRKAGLVEYRQSGQRIAVAPLAKYDTLIDVIERQHGIKLDPTKPLLPQITELRSKIEAQKIVTPLPERPLTPDIETKITTRSTAIDPVKTSAGSAGKAKALLGFGGVAIIAGIGSIILERSMGLVEDAQQANFNELLKSLTDNYETIWQYRLIREEYNELILEHLANTN